MDLTAGLASIASNPPKGICPFDRKSGKVVPYIQGRHWVVVKALGQNNNWLIVPNQHLVNPFAVPQEWWGEAFELAEKIPGFDWENFNISINCGNGKNKLSGRKAGRRERHLHVWVIDRNDDPEGDGLGLAAYADLNRRVYARFGISLAELIESILSSHSVFTRWPL